MYISAMKKGEIYDEKSVKPKKVNEIPKYLVTKYKQS